MIGTTQRQTFTKILGASVVLHLGAVALFFVIADAHSKPEPKTVIATKLVRLGKERPKELLPRLAKEAPPQPAPAAPPAPKRPNPYLEHQAGDGTKNGAEGGGGGKKAATEKRKAEHAAADGDSEALSKRASGWQNFKRR